MEKNWKVYVIHHSHTDIGYTERQDKITRYHCDFIKQAISILERIDQTNDERYKDFVWQCENFWQVKQFYSRSSVEWQNRFEKYVKSGRIGLSGNYLNMTDLVSEEAFELVLSEMDEYKKRVGVDIRAGMSADINGLAWNYSEMLYRHGIQYFYTALHPHHGMFPLYKKTHPYYWITPSGKQILMWNGDHYHLGNEMFLCPHGGSNYTFHDEFSDSLIHNTSLNRDRESVNREEVDICIKRISRYLENLEKEEYPYDIVPFMVSGAITDNAPPNMEIAARLADLNRFFEGRVTFRMVTLEQFFDVVEERCEDIPSYTGDFTDWWADGVGSTAAATKVYLDATRKLSLCRKLDPKCIIVPKAKILETAEDFMMYAEHTWGYSSSISEPWDSMVEALEYKKTAYATNANTKISCILDEIMAHRGEVSIRQDRPQRYILINPHNHPFSGICSIYVEFWEYVDGLRFDPSMPIIVQNTETGKLLRSQVKQIARATQIEVEVDLKPCETMTVELHIDKNAFRPEETVRNYAHIGAEGVEDIVQRVREDEEVIETEYFVIRFADEIGIEDIEWKKDGSSLLRSGNRPAAFSGVYEITDMTDPCLVRKQMGRNRKARATRRYTSCLTDRKVVERGKLYTAVQLDYKLEGTQFYTVYIKAYKQLPRLEIQVRLHKTSRWEPENLYIALPFTAGSNTVFYADKLGHIFRPGLDQLPGTCQDFYLVQGVLAWEGCNKVVSVTAKDTPLIAVGDLCAHRIELCDPATSVRNADIVYSWPMNNFWETNFKADLSGFYEFRYTLQVDTDKTVEDVFVHCRDENEGIITAYTD